MKTLPILSCAVLLVTRASAQWVVNDPVNASINITTRIESLAKFAEQIKRAEDQILNQIRQIDEAKKLFDVQSQVKATIGDWQGVVDRAKSIKLEANNLGKNFNGDFRSLIKLDYGQTALRYDHVTAGAVVTTKNAFGLGVTTHPDETTRYWYLERSIDRALTTFTLTDQEIGEINREIADTYQRMTESGITQQEYEKLRGKIQTLNVRLDALRAQRRDAATAVDLQYKLNENRRQLEENTKQAVDDSNHATFVNGYTSVKFGELNWR